MNKELLTDTQIALIMKTALDNNAAIVQFCSLIYGEARSVKESNRKKWHAQMKKQWERYAEDMNRILENGK